MRKMNVTAAQEGFAAATQTGIYLISTSLLYPVIIILFLLICWSLIALGGFIYEWYKRDRDFVSLEHGAFKARTLLNEDDPDGAFDILSKACSTKYVHLFLIRLAMFRKAHQSKKLMEVKIEKLLHDLETAMMKRLEKSRFASRAGPMLGLMGTLIPMGPALLALAGGDIETLAKNLVVAFGSTVLGLAAGLIGHFLSMVRSRWYDQDMSDMEFLAEILFGDRGSEEALELGLIEECDFEKDDGYSQRLRHYISKKDRRERRKLREVFLMNGEEEEVVEDELHEAKE
uniref:MotA/TolQ/ExbB proton channel domain-containing protein n=1 Tax=Candidatus Methanophaga sp. ANME-1 ERB7 TaxID=2759913 RepID=A0A7G9ZDE4_9EURY|nr:hypothetical protein BFNMBJLP_00012 [Methanosarcinales archaeon ANME-1 ERB7]